MTRLNFILNETKSKIVKKKKEWEAKPKKKLLGELENAYFEIAKLKIEVLRLKKELQTQDIRLAQIVSEQEESNE